MINLWQPVRTLAAVAAILCLCMVQAPVAASGTNGTAPTQTTTPTSPQTDSATPQADAKVATATGTAAKPKAVTKPSEKSILDADVLDSPMSYLRDAFSTAESENVETTAHSGPIMMTLKALIASLLSTII